MRRGTAAEERVRVTGDVAHGHDGREVGGDLHGAVDEQRRRRGRGRCPRATRRWCTEPTASMTTSAGSSVPSLSDDRPRPGRRRRSASIVWPRWKWTPCRSCRRRMAAPELGAERPDHRLLVEGDDRDLAAELAGRRGVSHPMKPGAHDDDVRAGGQARPHGVRIGRRAQDVAADRRVRGWAGAGVGCPTRPRVRRSRGRPSRA